jgi:hypothetical protein
MGLLDGIGNYLFGIKPVDDSFATEQQQQLQQQAAAYAAREANAYAGQGRLASNLWDVVNGGGGPSVAGTQLEQGLDQTLAAGNSMAAGGSGANGALARYAAILSAGRSMADTNQTGALLRAQEVAGARQQLGGVLGAQAGESGNLYGTATSGGLAAAGIKAGIDESNQKSQAAVDGALLSGVSSLGAAGLTALGGPAASGPPKAVAAVSPYAAAAPGYAASLSAGPSPTASTDYGSLYSAAAPGYTASAGAGGVRDPNDPYGGGYGSNPYGDRY